MTRKNLKSICYRIISALCIIALCLTFFASCNEVSLSEDLAQIEKDLLNANNELESLQSDYDEALKKNEDLTENNEAAKQEIEALKAANEASKKEIEDLKVANESANKEITSLKATNEAANKTATDLKATNEAINTELEVLKASNEASLKEIEDLKNLISDLFNYVTPDSSEDKIKIYIDQGHNPTSYHNSGAVGNGLYEENLTFTIGRLLAGLLTLDERFEVCLSRPMSSTVLGTDNTSSLEARVQGAKDFEADYFISLHINSYTESSAHGIEVHTVSNTGESYDFGSALLDGLIDSTALRNRGMKQSPNLYVLKNATMPAVLVEMGFISNADDAKLLSANPELFAQGLYNGILNYFNLAPITSSSN